jgi:hypothetical protein
MTSPLATYATLLDALNRHRGKGQQKVTVEHVHVHTGGQAVVGMVETPGGGGKGNQRINPMQGKLPMHLSRQCGVWSADKARDPIPVASDAERPLPDARRDVAGRSEGNQNAFKHGRYTIEATANRREIADLLRTMRALAERTGDGG